MSETFAMRRMQTIEEAKGYMVRPYLRFDVPVRFYWLAFGVLAHLASGYYMEDV